MPIKDLGPKNLANQGRVGGVDPMEAVKEAEEAALKGVVPQSDNFGLGGTANVRNAAPPMPPTDPISGTAAEKMLEMLHGPAFAEGAAQADTQKALDQLTGMQGQVSPQQMLGLMKYLGLDVGNGLTDKKTVDAIKGVQEEAGLFPSGKLDLETLLALVEAANNKRSGASPGASRGTTAPGGGGGGGGSAGAANGQGSDTGMVPRRSAPGGAQGASSAPGAAPTGTLKANQKEAYDAAIKEGLSPTAAKALVANMTGESLSKPNDNHWDVSHMSQGIVQWDPTRSAAIKRQFGKEPKDMTVAEQTKAAIWEMKNNPAYRQTWNALQGGDAHAMVSALVRNYERPANPDGEINKRMGNYSQLGHLDA